MVAPGNRDGHRRSYAGMKGVTETEKWGRNTARERYGKLEQPDMRPKDMSAPQKLGDRNNLRGPGWEGDTPNNWLRGNGHKPGFDRMFRPRGSK